MTAVLFIRADDLLKASHYKRITVPGHTHGGKWVSPYTKNVLVSDDHDTDKVAAGSGSFYQKQAHKKLAGMVDGFSTMNPDAKASLIVAHATDMQIAASASAAVSGFKSSMLDGKVPTKAQYFAMQNASSKVQGDVADACVAAIGADKYEQLLMAASAKHNQPQEKNLVTSSSKAQQTTQEGSKPSSAAAVADATKPTKITRPSVAGQASVADDTITVSPMTGKTGPTTFKPAPDFADYAEAQAWVAARAKALGMSKSAFQASYEYSHAMPKLKAAYSVVKKEFDDKKAKIGAAMLTEMESAGVKLGDTVAFTQVGAFMSVTKYEGKVVMHDGVPHVKLAYEVAVTKPGGKIGYTKFLQWAPHMKVKGAPAAALGSDGATSWANATHSEKKKFAEKVLGWKPDAAGVIAANEFDSFGEVDQQKITEYFATNVAGGAKDAGYKVVAGGKGKIVPVGQTIAYHHTSGAAAQSIASGGFKDSMNSMYGKAVYLTDTKDGFNSSDALITVTLAPHNQVQIANDTDAAAVYQSISGMDKNGVMFDSGFSKKMADAGVGSALIKVDDQMYTVVFDKDLIIDKSVSSKSRPKEGDTKPGADGSNLVFKDGRWHKYVDADESGEVPPVLVPVDDDSANHKAAVAAMETGAFYQKEAVKKLKAEHGAAWADMHPSKQHALAHAKYQALQGAASQAAAVSGWKKHMLSGQVPTPGEVKAMSAFDTATPDKAVKVMNEVQAVIGLDKYVQLVTQAHAKSAKAQAATPAAKVFVTTQPAAPAQAKPLTLAEKPAYDHIAQSVKSKMSHSLPSQKTFHKLAAQDWMAANPDKGAEMYEALAAHKLGHLAAMVGPGVKPAEAPAAKPVNAYKEKFKNNSDVNNFILIFKLHGGKAAQNLPIDEMLDAEDIAAFNKLTPEEKMDVAAAISFYGPHKLQLFMTWLGAQNANAAAPAAPTGPVPVTSLVFTNTTTGHNKFWSVSTNGKVMKTTYGKLGTQGSTTTKEFASISAAAIAAEKLKSEKIGKGYVYAYTGVHQYEGAAPAATIPSTPAAGGGQSGLKGKGDVVGLDA